MQPQKILSTLLIKPAGPDCNLDCTYCFYLDKAGLFPETSKHRMSEAVLDELIRKAFDGNAEHISFVWQGGEPTLAGLPFFQKAVDLQLKYSSGKTASNGLQTNGLLLNPNWARFLIEYNFIVGLSLDGPQHIHDHYRTTKGGQPTWQHVHTAAELLLDKGLAVNALTVVTDYSAQFPEEIYDYHKSLGLSYMQFIPCVEHDKSLPGSAAPFSVTAEAYGNFLIRLFDCWYADIKDEVAETSVRFFDALFHKYVNLAVPDCTLEKECGVYLLVEHNGDVYTCDFFVEDAWRLGNIAESNLADLLNSSRQNEFGRLKAALPAECFSCKWLAYCRGGCTKDRIRDPRDRGSNHFCKSFKMFFEHAHDKMRWLGSEWKRKQTNTYKTTF
jgi:uncharacterized protein